MTALQVRNGQTFQISCRIADRSGAPIDLSGFAITAQVRDALGVLVADLSGRPPVGHVGIVNLWASGPISWPCGRLFCDLRFLRPDGVIQFSEQFAIQVSTPVTRAGSAS
ncbi:hypothetical protein [Gluconobacter frateurii]|uniref:Uncharacterized protein n=1 Tax=Gluconobacter frateurii NRIC 0228 TaxID=1307946 RepID=A0ABQ0Q914_9PROT|nr:hypothetical protein [Gluconobacter frateurii]GBR09536.1 hypothetical protein AA0228_0710 [Gluconobacter frateurii NRIC 0228]GLP91927.1 hypothetical protein GCM10007868_30020 [Gluconobacter frateurii]